MAKTAGKAKKKNSAFMKPMQPSEQLAKIVGAEPLPRSEVTKKIWAHIKKHKLQIQKISVKSSPMTSYSQFSALKNWTCFR